MSYACAYGPSHTEIPLYVHLNELGVGIRLVEAAALVQPPRSGAGESVPNCIIDWGSCPNSRNDGIECTVIQLGKECRGPFIEAVFTF